MSQARAPKKSWIFLVLVVAAVVVPLVWLQLFPLREQFLSIYLGLHAAYLAVMAYLLISIVRVESSLAIVGWVVLTLVNLGTLLQQMTIVDAAAANVLDGFGFAGLIMLGIALIGDHEELEKVASESDGYRKLALYDQLTGLPNQLLLLDRLKILLAQAQREKKLVGIYHLHIDNFDNIRQRFGLTSADEVLVEIAQRLDNAMRGTDTVARVGYDQFVVVAGSMADPQFESIVRQKIAQIFAQPVMMGTFDIDVKLAQRSLIYPADGHDADILLSMLMENNEL